MDGYSVWTQEQVHKFIFTQTPTVPPTSFWIALSRASFTPAATTIDEPTGIGSYAREEAAAFTGPGTDPSYVTTTSNSADITFVESTASWGLITDFAAWSTSTAGDLIFGGALDTEKTIETATIAVFSTGDLKLSTQNTP